MSICSDWNPHADLQAMARAHRLGQTNKVLNFLFWNVLWHTAAVHCFYSGAWFDVAGNDLSVSNTRDH